MDKKKIIYISVASTFVLVFTIFLGSTILNHRKYSGRFYQGISVHDIDLGGKTLTEAVEILESEIDLNINFTLEALGQNWQIPLIEIIEYNIEETLGDIFSEIEQAGMFKSIGVRRQLKKNPKSYNIDFTVLESFTDKLLEIKEQVDQKPIDALFEITTDKKVSIKPHQEGISVNLENTLNKVKNSINDNIYNSEIYFDTVSPITTSEDLSNLKVEELLFSVSTSYAGTGENRIHNIRNAASKIKNYLLKPGEEFSYNSLAGPFGTSNGYKEAYVISNNQFVLGLGGGVCQLSSTIYWGVLKANLQVTQRYNHSRPITYMPLGLDAAVSYPNADFKFKNNTPYGIIINTVTSPTHVTVDFYSFKEHFPQVTFESEERIINFKTEYNENPNLPKGEKNVVQKGANGYSVKTYRITTKDGQNIRELISTDYYNSLTEIIEIGIKEID